jgi:hypothetical protein
MLGFCNKARDARNHSLPSNGQADLIWSRNDRFVKSRRHIVVFGLVSLSHTRTGSNFCPEESQDRDRVPYEIEKHSPIWTCAGNLVFSCTSEQEALQREAVTKLGS